MDYFKIKSDLLEYKNRRSFVDLIDEVEDCGDGELFFGVDFIVSVDGFFVDVEVVVDL